MVLWLEPEPELTDTLVALGFVVEREVQTFDNGYQDVKLYATPQAQDISHSLTWHRSGPTASFEDVCIRWEADRRAVVIADAEHPIEYGDPDVPADSVVVAEGSGWDAVVPADRVIERMILWRSDAKRYGYEILQDVPSWIEDADECDLVVVDADPVASGDRRRDVRGGDA